MQMTNANLVVIRRDNAFALSPLRRNRGALLRDCISSFRGAFQSPKRPVWALGRIICPIRRECLIGSPGGCPHKVAVEVPLILSGNEALAVATCEIGGAGTGCFVHTIDTGATIFTSERSKVNRWKLVSTVWVRTGVISCTEYLFYFRNLTKTLLCKFVLKKFPAKLLIEKRSEITFRSRLLL